MMINAGCNRAFSIASCSLLTNSTGQPERFADSLILTLKNKSSTTARTLLFPIGGIGRGAKPNSNTRAPRTCNFCHDEVLNTHRYPDSLAAAEACGTRAIELIEQALKARGKASLAISGGSSPKPMYAFFSRTKIDWASVHVFWVDERGVPP